MDHKEGKTFFLFNSADAFLSVVFLLVSLFNAWLAINHVCWRDEAQAWLIARDNVLLADSLFTITSYEGHPILWFLILMPFAKAGAGYSVLKLLSWMFMTGALFVLLFKTKYPAFFRILIAASPAFIAFFTVPARSYSLCAFLLLLLAVAYDKRKDNTIVYGLLLAFMLQTLVIMAGFVFICCVCWLVESLCEYRAGRDRKRLGKQAVGLVLPLVSALFLLWEFRYTSSITSGKMDAGLSMLEAVRSMYEQFYDSNVAVFGQAAPAALFIMIGIVLLSAVKYRRISPLIILVFSILWQVFIYAFIYPSGSHRVLTWLLLFVWYGNTAIDWYELYCKPVVQRIGLILSSVLLVLSWNYKPRNSIVPDLKKDGVEYSDSLRAASVINSLPPESPVIEIEYGGDRCSAIIPYLDEDHFLFDPVTGKKASNVDRNPDIDRTISYEQFREFVCSLDAGKYVWLVWDKQKNAFCVDEIMEHIDVGEIIYEADDTGSINEKFILVKIDKNDL